MAEETGLFIMDSGAFLDVIPLVLNHLYLKSLIQLSQTCHFWRQRIYNDIKLWPKIIELPYSGCMEGGYSGHIDPEKAIQAKVWSMIMPPEDPKALEKVLSKMALSEESIQRFKLVTKVEFKNYIHTDNSLRLTALLFPSIEQISFEGNLLTITGVQYIAESCQNLKYIEFYQCNNLHKPDFFRLFNTKEHEINLERIFFHDDHPFTYQKDFLIEHYLPFMALSQRCKLFFNKFKNEKNTLCLHHPGVLNGYGRSCSSYNCCGSNLPSSPSALGCQYTYHTTISESSSPFDSMRIYELQQGHPEYMFQRFNYDTLSFEPLGRRRLDFCYKKWNEKK